MISFEDRKDVRQVGVRLLVVLLIYSYASTFLLSLLISVPFIRSIFSQLMELAAQGETISQDALYTQLQSYMADNEPLMQTLSYLASCVCALLGALIFALLLRKNDHPLPRLYSLRGFSLPCAGLAIVASLGINYAAGLVSMATDWLYGLFDLSVLYPIAGSDHWIYYLYVILLAPVAEELMFRGGVLRLLRPKGERFALTASAICFALFHGNLAQLPTALLLGLWFGYLALKTDSLVLPTLAHIGANLLSVLINLLAAQYPRADLILLGAGLVLGYMALRLLYRRMGSVSEETPSPQLRSAFYGSLPMIIFLSFCTVSIIMSVQVL